MRLTPEPASVRGVVIVPSVNRHGFWKVPSKMKVRRIGRFGRRRDQGATASLAGSLHKATPRRGDLVITSDGEEPSTVHGTTLAPHIRAVLPIGGLAR